MTVSAQTFRAAAGRTLIEIQKKPDKIGSIYIVEDKSKERATALDQISGVVVGGEHGGKTAFFHKNTYKMALRGQDKAMFEEEGRTFLVVQDNDIFLYAVNLKNLDKGIDSIFIEMKPEWVLVIPPDDSWEVINEGASVFMGKKTESGIYIGKSEKHKEETMIAEIAHINPATSAEFSIFVGDKVYLDKATDIPLESEINRILDRKYFRVNIENILGKCLV